jgi:hypothetical protein
MLSTEFTESAGDKQRKETANSSAKNLRDKAVILV